MTISGLSKKKFIGNNLMFTDLGIRAKSIDVCNTPIHKKLEQVRDEIPTLNKYGYMKSELEYYSSYFLELTKKARDPVLEIGTAYGWLTHKALELGSVVVANDLCKEHLEVLVKEAPEKYLDNLYVYQGAFPNEVFFKDDSFDAIMASRILHFLDGDTLEGGLDKLYSWLKPDGKLIATNCSIYHSSVKGKMSGVFQERIMNGEKWPGMSTKDDFDSVHNDYSTHFLNCFYKEQLEELLPKHGFKIEKISYFDYPSDPWPDEGKGHIGFLAQKI